MRIVLRLVALLAVLAAPAFAQAAPDSPAPSKDDAIRAEVRAAYDAAQKAAVRGPAVVTLTNEGKLTIPAGMEWIPQAPADRLMRALGNEHDDRELGIVIGDKLDWIVDVQFFGDGFVRDDDARDWKADDLLKGLQDATLAGNADRQARGFTPLQVTGWLEPPAYDAATHRLVWSAALDQLGQPSTDGDGGVNYNTRVLGRDGYISINLITSRSDLAQFKPFVTSLLNGFSFDAGKRYADFTESTDRVAEYGLAGLLGIVAVKKLGLIALIGAAILKFGKLILIALAGGGALFARFFRRRRPTTPA